jgi:hypothetical protein
MASVIVGLRANVRKRPIGGCPDGIILASSSPVLGS